MKVAASLDHTAVRSRSTAKAADGRSFLPLLIIHADSFTGIKVRDHIFANRWTKHQPQGSGVFDRSRRGPLRSPTRP